MKLTSSEALRADLDAINKRIAELQTTRGALSRALALIEGEAKPVVKIHKEVAVDSLVDLVDDAVDLLTDAHPEQKVPERRRTRIGRITETMVRDAVLAMNGEPFTSKRLADHIGASKTGLHPHLHKLLQRGVIVIHEHNPPYAIVYKYNSEFPAAPTERPRVTPPEKELIDNVTRSIPNSNGRIHVSDKTIQSFIDEAYAQGWNVVQKAGNHLKFVSPSGRTVGVNAKPPRPQITEVIKRDLKRSGLRLA